VQLNLQFLTSVRLLVSPALCGISGSEHKQFLLQNGQGSSIHNTQGTDAPGVEGKQPVQSRTCARH
jgi:hypothetical protein